MAKNWGFRMGFWTAGLLLLALGRGIEGDAWDDTMSLVELLDGEGFKRLVNPLVEMSANAYRFPDVISIEGWTLVDAVAPIHGGMHAVLYKDHSNTGRMVLAFRGTQLSEEESSRADVCADEILWVDVSILDPADCSQFSIDTLDYYNQAVNYTRKVLKAYPQASLLLTGHSLGAGLAILVAATFSTNPLLPVIVFGAPGTKTVLKTRSLKLTQDHDKKLYIISDKWDYIMRTTWKNQVGTLCLYDTTIPENCAACISGWWAPVSAGSLKHPGARHGPDLQSQAPGITKVIAQQCEDTVEKLLELELIEGGPALKGSSTECTGCFFETHYLQHIIDLVELGNKPVCEPYPLSTIHYPLSTIRK